MSTNIEAAKRLRDELPAYATDSTYVRWLVNVVYFLLCRYIEGQGKL
jgi:hypothetical protein